MLKKKDGKTIWTLSLTRKAEPLWLIPMMQGVVSGDGVPFKRERRTEELAVWKGDKGKFYCNKSELECEGRALTNSVLSGQDYHREYLRRALRCCKTLIELAAYMTQTRHDKLNNKELADVFTKVNRALFAAGTTIIRPRAHAEMVVMHSLEKKLRGSKTKAAECMSLLYSSPYLNSAQKEKMAFLELAIKAQKNVFSQDKINSLLKEHTKEYAWLSTDFRFGKPLTLSIFKTRFKDCLKRDCSLELNDLKDYPSLIRSRQKEIFKELALSPEIQRLCKIGSITGFIRLERRYAINRLLYFAESFFEELRKRLSLVNLHNLGFCENKEVISGLLQRKPIDLALLERRQLGCVVYISRDATVYYTDKEADRFLAKQTFEKVKLRGGNLEGSVACKGKVMGVVRVILDIKDIKKVKNGDILVSSETTPDFLLAIERAAAFVTDEGGLGCHAAVVAREMNKPCIVGTKMATEVLKDGDMVEVDAEKGIVKIIKK